jgi:DNA-binding NtrC family response regulator
LRDRREDIPPLASYFLSNYAVKYRKPAAAFEPAAMRAMLEHDWPGNVREMQHAIERAVLLAQSDKIQASDFGLRGARTPQRLEDLSLEQVESLLIRKAMARYEGNVSKTANALGLSRSALYRRLDRYGIA